MEQRIDSAQLKDGVIGKWPVREAGVGKTRRNAGCRARRTKLSGHSIAMRTLVAFGVAAVVLATPYAGRARISAIAAYGQNQDTAAVLAAKEGQLPMGKQWGVRYAVVTDPSLPRVLLIGDSIVNGYGAKVAERLKNQANVDIWVTPNWLGPDLSKQAQSVLMAAKYTVIHFNESGLHAWAPGRIADSQYGPLMQNYLSVLRSAGGDVQLIWASTTPITQEDHPGQLDPLDQLIMERNALCLPIMKKNGVAVDDLHTLMINHLDLARGDRFHWVDRGYDLMAESVASSVTRELTRNKPN